MNQAWSDGALVVVTGYVRIPDHPRSPDQYDLLGKQLDTLRIGSVCMFRCELEDCWLYTHVGNRSVEHAIADNPKKNTVAYHIVQHQKTAWLLQALETNPSAEVFVWLDYGILHQPGVTTEIIDDYLRRVRPSRDVVIPGAWDRSGDAAEFDWRSPDWRFCGSSFVVPRGLVRCFHDAVRKVTLERLSSSGRLTWEVNDWAEVERRKIVPIHWYRADHDQTQFMNYAPDGETSMEMTPDPSSADSPEPVVPPPSTPAFHPAFSPASCYILRDAAEAAYFARSGGAPEARLIDWATQLVRSNQSFIDVGAHVGTWAQHFAQKCRRVYAFEPQKSTYDRLLEGIRLAGLRNIDCYEVALGAQGEADLHVVSVDGGGSTLHHRQELGPDLTVERVRAAQLDDYDFEAVDLIKIDAEGAESDILRGSMKTLKTHGYPTLLLEAWLHGWYAEERAALIAQIEAIGYHVQPVMNCPEMLLAEHPDRRIDSEHRSHEKKPTPIVVRALSTERSLLGLVMIVKNESKRISEVLASYRPYIDAWTILDTGSIDGTQELIRAELADLPGVLYEEPFVDFATSRNRALDLHGISTVFSIMPNGDVLSGGAELRSFLEARRGDHSGSYRVRISPGHYYHPLVMRTGFGWRYKWRTHECAMGPNQGPQIPGVSVVRDRGSRTDAEWRQRWERDLVLLNKDREEDPSDPRPYFYLGQTHECLGQHAQALSFFERRAEMGGYFDEVYEAKFRIARMKEELDRPWPEVQQAYLEAYAHDPRRAEPLFEISDYWYDNVHAISRIFAAAAARTPKPPTDLFLDEEIYEWRAADRAAISSSYSGHMEDARYFGEMAVRARPNDERIRSNRAFYTQSAQELFGAVARAIDFSPEAGWNLSNPSIYRHEGHIRCVVRTVNYKIVNGSYVTPPTDVVAEECSWKGWQVIRTRNFLLDLDEDLKTRRAVEMVDATSTPRTLYPVHGFEDARLFAWKGKWWATATVCDFTEEGSREIALLQIEDDGSVSRAEPLRGPWSGQPQKNWMPFVDGDVARFVYAASPMEIFELIEGDGQHAILRAENGPLGHGRLRGGSQGVHVDGGWIFVVHDVAFPGSGRIYLHRFIRLDDQLKLTSMSDPFYFEQRGIEFSAGLARLGDKLVASYAVNDGSARLATFDLKAVEQALRKNFVI